MHDSRHEVAKAEHAILPHIAQDKKRKRTLGNNEADFAKSITQSLRSQHTHLLPRMRLEHQLPVLEAAHQVFEVGEGNATCAVLL